MTRVTTRGGGDASRLDVVFATFPDCGALRDDLKGVVRLLFLAVINETGSSRSPPLILVITWSGGVARPSCHFKAFAAGR